jgi:uncharacterized repeat protein (TIGR02543 family)
MTNWFPGLAGIDDRGFGGSRGGDTINGVVLHHTTSIAPSSSLGYVAGPNSRNSHPTYLVKNSGAAFGIVHPDRKPFSTAGRPDSEAVAFEIDNAGGAPRWPTSAAAKETVAQIIAYHYRHSNRFGNGIARNIVGQYQREFFVAWHRQYAATTCCGDDTIDAVNAIIKRAMEIAHPTAPPVEPPKPPAPVVFKVVFDDSPDDPASDYRKVDVVKGEKVAEPEIVPVRSGFEFVGWFDLNGSTTKPYDFSKPVNGLLTLVAGWSEVVPPEPEPEPADYSDWAHDIEGQTEIAQSGDSGRSGALSGLFAGNDAGRKRAYLIYASAALLVSFGPDIVTAGIVAGADLPTFTAYITLASSLLLKIGTALGFVAASNTSKS